MPSKTNNKGTTIKKQINNNKATPIKKRRTTKKEHQSKPCQICDTNLKRGLYKEGAICTHDNIDKQWFKENRREILLGSKKFESIERPYSLKKCHKCNKWHIDIYNEDYNIVLSAYGYIDNKGLIKEINNRYIFINSFSYHQRANVERAEKCLIDDYKEKVWYKGPNKGTKIGG